jgi:tRNA pseudouridine-54 N-methylase
MEAQNRRGLDYPGPDCNDPLIARALTNALFTKPKVKRHCFLPADHRGCKGSPAAFQALMPPAKL